ncbi:MAG: hypothetical protein KUG80_07360, partial [Gammaproteobacteria bacterium]|nr:hypothetical protein [Gammaproteobacteria bacterium]
VDAQEIRQRIEDEIEKTGIKETAAELQEQAADIQEDIKLSAEKLDQSTEALNTLPSDKNH